MAEALLEGISVVWIEVGQNVVSSGASLDASVKGVPDRFVTDGVERSSVPYNVEGVAADVSFWSSVYLCTSVVEAPNTVEDASVAVVSVLETDGGREVVVSGTAVDASIVVLSVP